MHPWAIRQKRMGDDPPFLTVGTEVSAKYKGAFCEAKVRKVVRSVKCKVTFKLGLGTISITDDQIRGGTLRVGSVCEVKHPEKKEFVEAIINKIQDCSQYTVVFDDGDITTLRRTALCLKSGRHFAESETLDQLPLTHPEHFSNPVIGGRKGRRSRQTQEETSDEEDPPKKGKKKEEKEADIGKVVCVELGDKKKQKDNWFPGLVVAPTAQDTVRIRVKDEYLVRSFKDGRYFTVPKKEATEFTREIGNKVDNHTLKAAVEKALQYLDRDELPPHWDRDLLFGLDESSGNSDSDGALDSDSSDDEPREEKDHFVAQLYKFMDDRGTPINKGPTIGSRDVDLYKLFKVVHKLGGYNRVTNHNQWKTIAQKLGFGQGNSSITNLVKQSYKKFLHSFEDFYRKLGCTMVNHPRGHRSRHRTGRSLIRDRDRTTPTIVAKDKEKKEEKVTPAPEKPSSETAEKESSAPKASVAPENKKEEEKPREEEKKEETKPKESTKKSKAREDKTETQSKQKGKEASEGSQTESEEKDNRSRSKKDTKSSDSKVPRLFEDLEKEETDTAPEEVPEQELEVTEETKSRESKGKTRETKTKERLKAASEKSKVKEEKVKVPDEEKIEDSKKKVDKKAPAEEDEKHTRAKSKEDVKNKKEVGSSRENQRETRTPVRDSSNRTPVRLRKEEESAPGSLKKRGRKRKETEEKAKAEESMGHLASHVSVCVGDKLKVYYGPTHESKVTYEAKVLDIEEDGSECMYLVHYTGWNTRYDEWIKRGRIADNLSWTPSRAKRQRQQQSQHKTSRLSHGKRGRPSISGRSQEGIPNPPRSTTPSSVTSSSSRTKSPATRTTPRSGRSAGESASPGHEFRRRTRRMSGHTDISMASDSETEEFESEAEPESEMAQTRSRTTEQRRSATASATSSATAASTPQPVPDKDDHPPPPNIPKEEPIRRAGVTRKKPTGGGKKKDPPVESARAATPADEEQEEEKPVVEPMEPQPNIEKRRSKRGKSSPAINSRSSPQRPKLTPEIKSEVKAEMSAGTESEEDIIQPKGRDFDLNQIRSELKGIEKAVKSPLDLTPPPPLPGEVADDEDEGDEEETVDTKEEQEVKTEVKQETKTCGKSVSAIPALFADIDNDDDVDEEEEIKIKPKELVCEIPTASASKAANSSLLLVEEEEDVYEFKEPEPFEFEVRREKLLLDSKGLARRPGITSSRIYELPVPAPDPSPPPLLTGATAVLTTSLTTRFSDAKSPRKRHIRTPPKDATTESSKKIRRATQKKLVTEVAKTVTETKDEKSACNMLSSQTQSSVPEQVPIPSPLPSFSSRPTSSIDLSYEKLCTTEASSLTTVAILSTSSQMVKSSLAGRTLIVTSPIPSSSIDENPVSPPLLSLPDDDDDDEARKSSELGPLSIFSQGQDDDADDDHEDRLVISESDDMVTEIAEPLFSYQQRDHEDIFPTLVTSTAVVTAAEGTDSCKSDDPPCLSPVVAPTSLFQGFTSPLREPSDISLGANVGSAICAVVTQGRLPLQQHQPQHKQQPEAQQPPQLQQQKLLLPQHFQPLHLEIASPLKQLSDSLQHPRKLLEPLQMPKQLLESSHLPKLQLELPQTTKQQLELPKIPKALEHTEIPKLLLEPSQHSKLFIDEPKLFVDEPQLQSPLLEPPISAKKQGEVVPKQDQERTLLTRLQQEQVQIIKLSPEQLQSTKLQQEQFQSTKQPQELPSLSKQLEHSEEHSLLLVPQQEQPLQQDLQQTSQFKPRSPHPNEADRRTKISSPAKSQSSVSGSPNETRPEEDEIKDLLKHQEDDYEDESINAAIQRALDRSIIDEEDEETTGAMELFCGKETLTSVESNDPIPPGANVSLMNPPKDSPPSSASPGHSTGSTAARKRVTCVSLGPGFLDSDDSAADSSDDEGQRLIIDPMDDEGSSQPRSCSSPLSSSELRLQISEDDVETRPPDIEDDADMDTAVDDELRTEDEETLEEASIVITRNASPTLPPDDNSSTSEAVTSGPVVTEEDTMEAEDLQSATPAEEEQEEEEEVEDDDTLEEAPCNRLSLHSGDAAIDVSECHDSITPVMTPVIVKVDLEDTSKIAEAEILSGGVVVLDASSELTAAHGVDQSLNSSCHTTPTLVTATIVASSPSSLNPQSPTSNIVCESGAPSDTSPILALAAVPLGEAEAAEIRQETRSDDADSQLLGSLLCQETIPGSPAQAGEGISEDHMPESKVLVLEMPFASVPASSCDATGSTMSLPVPISVPLNIPVVTSASVATTAPASTTATVVAAEVLTNVAVTVSDVEPANEDVPAASAAVAVAPAGPAQHLLADPSPGVSKLNSNHAATVMENTPPTTPDSTLSTMSNSPREMLGDMSPPSPPMDNESSKSHRDSFEMDLDSCQEGTKVDHFSEDDSLLNVEVSNSCDNRLQGLKLVPKKSVLDLDKDNEASPKKRRRSRKRSESESNKRARCSSGRNVRPTGGTGSDSDDTSENSALGCTPMASSESTLSSKSPRPSKYNFYVELDPELDGSQRIALLQQKLQELRKTYMSVKAELACIDRRRKKLRRREREVEKATKQEVACS